MGKKDLFTDVLWMSRYHYGHQSAVLDHSHTFYQIIYFIEGTGILHLGTEQFEIKCPSVLLLKPDEIHGLVISDTLKTIDIKFAVTSPEFAEKLAELPGLILKPDRFDSLFLIESMLQIGGEERCYYRERCRFLLNLILMEWLESEVETDRSEQADRVYSDSPSGKSNICSRLIEFIDMNISQDFESKALSDKLGFSYRYISTCCLKEYSMTPMQLVKSRRVQRAKELLMRDNSEIKEIAYELGFKSIYHFSRVFSEFAGQPPGKWKDYQLRKICRDININPNYYNELHLKKTD